VIDPTIVSRLVGRRRWRSPLGLTEREREVLALLADELSNLAIATGFVTERTVEAHTKQIFGKLELEADPACNRRVLAVLAFLCSQSPEVPRASPSAALWRCSAACSRHLKKLSQL
jgi:DNA-binding NarL/FixJ family response regulator